jgi:hypothetical protein
MKYAILFTLIIGTFATTSMAQELGWELVPASESPVGKETLVITYTQLEDSTVQLYEASLPATTQAACLASRDFTSGVPIPPDRVSQFYSGGKKVVIAFVKTERVGPCSVIFGRSGTNLNDFNFVRANFGAEGLAETSIQKTDEPKSVDLRSRGHVFKLTRHFDADGLRPAGSH